MKDRLLDWWYVWGDYVRMTILTVFVVLVISSVAIGCMAKFAEPQTNAIQNCLSFGYPKAQYANGEYYCLRSVGGTDEVVPLRRLMK